MSVSQGRPFSPTQALIFFFQNKHELKVLFNSFTRKPVKCCNEVKGESQGQTHLQIGNIKMTVQTEPNWVFWLFFHWTEFICVSMDKNNLALLPVMYNL